MKNHKTPSNPEPPRDRLLRKKECADHLGVSTRTFERLVAAGVFPRPLTISENSKRWRQSWIEDYLRGLEGSAS